MKKRKGYGIQNNLKSAIKIRKNKLPMDFQNSLIDIKNKKILNYYLCFVSKVNLNFVEAEKCAYSIKICIAHSPCQVF